MAVGFAVSALLLYVALRRVDAGEAWDAVKGANPLWLAAGVVGVNVGLLGMAARWRLLSAGLAPRVPSAGGFLRVIVAAQAVNGVVPARAGDVVRVAWLGREAGIGAAPAAASMVADRALDVLALTLIIAVGFPFVPQERWVTAVGVAAAAGCVALAVVWVSCRAYAARRGGDEPAGRVKRQLARFAVSFGSVVRDAPVARMAAWTVMVWGTWALGAWAVAEAMDLGVSPVELLFVAGVLNVGLAIPSSPGFVGTYQWLTVSGLELFGVAASPAFAYSVLLQLTWFVPQTVAGLALLPKVGASFARLRGGSRDAAPG